MCFSSSPLTSPQRMHVLACCCFVFSIIRRDLMHNESWRTDRTRIIETRPPIVCVSVYICLPAMPVYIYLSVCLSACLSARQIMDHQNSSCDIRAPWLEVPPSHLHRCREHAVPAGEAAAGADEESKVLFKVGSGFLAICLAFLKIFSSSPFLRTTKLVTNGNRMSS